MTQPDGTCPCCAGADEGDWTDLCDICAAAWVAGEHRKPHGCARPGGEQ